MRAIFILIFCYISIQFIPAQTVKFVNSENPGKVKILDRFDYIEIALKEKKTEKKSITRNYAGFLGESGEGKLVINADYEYIDELVFEPYSSVLITKEFYDDTNSVRSFSPEEIEYVVHQKKFGTIFGNIGVACLYGAIIAPALCIDYTKGEVLSGQYFLVAGGFLTLAGISYTLSFTFGEKKFYITPNSAQKSKKVWNLVVD